MTRHPLQSAPPVAPGGSGSISDTTILPDDALGWTYDELSQLLRVSTRTIRDWVRFEGLPACKIKRAVRFRPEAVRAWLRDREGGAA